MPADLDPHEPLPAGSRAPDFAMACTGGRRLTLKDMLKQGPVALFFYPGNNTPG